MSLLLAEYFIELSDSHAAQAKVCEKIADELSEGNVHPFVKADPVVTEDPHKDKLSNELTADELAESGEAAANAAAAKKETEAAEKKKAAAAKRRATAKAKKEAAAAAEKAEAVEPEPEVEPDVDLTALLARAQELTRKHIKDSGVDATKAIFAQFKIGRVSEAADDGDVLSGVIDALTTSLEAGALV